MGPNSKFAFQAPLILVGTQIRGTSAPSRQHQGCPEQLLRRGVLSYTAEVVKEPLVHNPADDAMPLPTTHIRGCTKTVAQQHTLHRS